MEADGRPLVVVVDDDAAMVLLCRVNLELEGYRVAEAAGVDDLLALAAGGEVALALLDLHLGSEDGVAVAGSLRERHPAIPIVLISGSAEFGERADAVSEAAIRKPFALEELIETVRRLAPAPDPAPARAPSPAPPPPAASL